MTQAPTERKPPLATRSAWRRAVLASDADSSTKLVVLALEARANSEGQCWPSLRQLAEDTSLGQRTVQRALARAEGRFLERSSRTRANGGATSTVYTLHRFPSEGVVTMTTPLSHHDHTPGHSGQAPLVTVATEYDQVNKTKKNHPPTPQADRERGEVVVGEDQGERLRAAWEDALGEPCPRTLDLTHPQAPTALHGLLLALLDGSEVRSPAGLYAHRLRSATGEPEAVEVVEELAARLRRGREEPVRLAERDTRRDLSALARQHLEELRSVPTPTPEEIRAGLDDIKRALGVA